MNKKTAQWSVFIVIVGAGFFFLPGLRQTEENAFCQDCNVLLISIDTLRADHLGSYGYHRDTSAQIDLFAQEGVLFKNAFSNSVNTAPSHMSIFTGMYPNRHGVADIEQTLSRDKSVLTEILKNNNYTTVFFTTNDPHIAKQRGYRKVDYFFHPSYFSLNKNHPIFDWLDHIKDKKFFAFLHLYNVHDPYLPPKRYRDQFSPVYDQNLSESEKLNVYRNAQEKVRRAEDVFNEKVRYIISNRLGREDQSDDLRKAVNEVKEYFFSQFDLNTQQDLHHLIALYDAGILYVDEFLGNLFSTLKKLDLDKRTLIVLTSDHGEEFNEHGNITHVQLYDETIHVPLIMRHPHLKGREVNELVQSIDIVPTVLNILNIPVPIDVQGKSLKDLMQGKAEEVHAFVYAQWAGSSAIRSKTRKLIRKGQNIEFYDLLKDPKEQKNLANEDRGEIIEYNDQLLSWELDNLDGP